MMVDLHKLSRRQQLTVAAAIIRENDERRLPGSQSAWAELAEAVLGAEDEDLSSAEPLFAQLGASSNEDVLAWLAKMVEGRIQ